MGVTRPFVPLVMCRPGVTLRAALKQRDGAAAARVIGSVFRSYTEYTTDVAVYRAARTTMLETLSR